MAEEKEAIAQYGSADSGASLGDILGAALKKAKTPTRSDAPPGASSRARRKPRPTSSTERPSAKIPALRFASAGKTTDG